jgi:undecaprenyl-diphosphatase
VGSLYAIWLRSTGDWRVGLPWERALMLGIDRDVPRIFDWVMLALPWSGTNLTVLPILVAFALWLWRWRHRAELAVQLVTVSLGSLIMNAVLKDLFDRPRPDLWEHRGQFAWASYPSGHAIVCTSVYFTIALMLYRERRWRWPFAVAGTLAIVSLYSRLYLGVHWPTDVFGGVTIGAVWLASTQYAFAPFLHRRPTHIVREPVPSGPDTLPAR